jgi:hypothetical protein
VSYSSLNHCARWRNDIPQLTIEELDGAEHREVLANRLFFKYPLLGLSEQLVTLHYPRGLLTHNL